MRTSIYIQSCVQSCVQSCAQSCVQEYTDIVESKTEVPFEEPPTSEIYDDYWLLPVWGGAVGEVRSYQRSR